MELSLKFPPNGSHGICLNVAGFKMNFSFNGRGKYIHILGLTCNEEMHSPSSKQRKCEGTLRLKYFFHKLNLCSLCVILQESKFRLFLKFHRHPVQMISSS